MILFKPAPGQTVEEARDAELKSLVKSFDHSTTVSELVEARLALGIGVSEPFGAEFKTWTKALPLLVLRVIKRLGLDSKTTSAFRPNQKPGLVPPLFTERAELGQKFAAKAAATSEGAP